MSLQYWEQLRAWVCWIRESLRHRQGPLSGTGFRGQLLPEQSPANPKEPPAGAPSDALPLFLKHIYDFYTQGDAFDLILWFSKYV